MTAADAGGESGTRQLFCSLERLLGKEHVLTGPDELAFYSSDILDEGVTAAMVVRPATPEEAGGAVALCTSSEHAVVARGGGLSYTGGYLPVRRSSVIFDLERLNRIVEINRDDMYVTVEAGVTWHQLYEALQPIGLRTPYWGTVSGYHATIGGSLSQGSTHFGSAEYGQSADSCLGLEVATASGAIVRTGSGASLYRPSPFFRGYGPDLTGLFLNDTGALGIKVRATLKLIAAPQHQRYRSFAFETLDQLMRAMAEVSRNRLAAECGGWNPALVRRFAAADEGIGNDLAYIASIARSGPSLLGGLRDAAGIAFAGRRAWKGDAFLMHATIDEQSVAAANDKAKKIDSIAEAFGGRSVPASYPRAHRARPFVSLTERRWIEERTTPTHGICPHSRALAMAKRVYALFDRNADLMARHGISWSLILSTIGNNATLVEPLIYHPDSRGPHYTLAPKDGRMPERASTGDAERVRAVKEVRRECARLFMENGCVHLQIGKSYPYRESREPEIWALLNAIKNHLDPNGLMNPGSLGLAAA